jgi:hypothetical protein
VSVPTGAPATFSAAVLDQFGQAMPGAAPQFTWSATGGAVTGGGVFTAGAVQGTYAVSAATGAKTGSLAVKVGAADKTAPALRSAVSRKTHGRQGPFDLPLLLAAGATSATVEPRLGGPTTLRFTFSERVVPRDGVLDAGEFVLTNAAFGSAELDPAGTTLTLNLSSVRDRRVVGVTLAGWADVGGNALAGDRDVLVRALAGVVNGSGVVDATDLLMIRRSLLRPLTGSAFLADLDANGWIDPTDLARTRRSIGYGVL